MVNTHYRWDFIGLSSFTKPTPETSEKVVDGSTYYCSDTSKLYVWCKDKWYERKPLGGGGGGGTTYTAGDGITIADDTISVDTTTIQPKLTAGSNITIASNTISATDTTYSNFTGTDGTAAGSNGLVPAPATTDAGKFLKADGTWDTAGGGGGATIKTLTSADFNWNSTAGDATTQPFDCVALWLLDEGWYSVGSLTATTQYKVGASGDDGGNLSSYGVFLIENTDSSRINIFGFVKSGVNASSTMEGIREWQIMKSTNAIEWYKYFLTSNIMLTTTGNSNYALMTQKATTSMVFRDPNSLQQVQIGSSANASGSTAVAIGDKSSVIQIGSVAIGANANAAPQYSIALGYQAKPTRQGEMNIGSGVYAAYGFNNTPYRVLGGVHDGQTLHDAATVAQGNTLSTSAPTTSTEGVLGQLWTDTTNMHTYQCTDISGSTYTWTQRW